MKLNTILLIVVLEATISAIHIISIVSLAETACGAGNSHAGDQNLKTSNNLEKVSAHTQGQTDNLIS
jgi:hypothetical protein